MASIVEKESGLPAELGKIAGLYLHRLSIGMRLQADPTIIYGMGDRYDGDIHTVDLRTDGPYNTYTRAGLPPTPIALPSAAVIRATAHPEKTDAIYFVASTKGDGSHVFSATLEAHNAAVAAYRRSSAAQSCAGFRDDEAGGTVVTTGRNRRRRQVHAGGAAVGGTAWQGIAHVVTREPGGTPLAESIRRGRADRARGNTAGDRGTAAHVCRASGTSRESCRAQPSGGTLGDLRSLH